MKTTLVKTLTVVTVATLVLGVTLFGTGQVQAEKQPPIHTQTPTVDECDECPPAFVDGEMYCELAGCRSECEYICIFDGDATAGRR